MMKVAILTPFNRNYGGGEVYINNLCRILNEEKKLDCVLLTPDDSIFDCKLLKIRDISSYFKLFKSSVYLLRFLRSHKFDILILNDIFISQFSWFIKKLTKCRVISLIHGEISYNRVNNPFLSRLITKIRAKLIWFGSDEIFSVNKSNLRYFKSKVTVIGNFLDKNFYSLVLQYENCAIEKIYDFIYCGRITGVKNLDKLICIFKQYVEQYDINSKLIIVGDGENLNHIKEMINKLKLEKNIALTGFVNRKELIKYYYQSKVLLLLSKSEGFPTVVLEALACGLPCIAINKGSISEVIINGYNGYIFDEVEGEEKSICVAMKELAMNNYKYYSNCKESVCNYLEDEFKERVLKKIVAE